ncbi:MAG: hypothetical protein NT002_00945 [candidate division Zixibacteria bacterium]|nr:hypothetical protein [candidate division Zixibacteria bacterium]
MTITDFYFRELSGDIPTDKESERRAKYIKMPVCDDSVPIDRRLREKALITWVAAGTRDDIKYKMYIIAEGEKDVLVKYDDKNSLPSFSFFKDDEFHPMNDAEGPHYWELWKVYYNKERKCQKLDLLPAGIYKCKMITQHKDEKPQEWISKNNIKIIGNPFCVTITCTAMDNNELAKEAESASKSKPEDVHYLDNIGRRIAKDSNLKVYRGDYDSDSVLIGRFKALMMPTQLNYVATPKGRYFGYRDRHKNEYACIELESEQIDSGNGTIILPEDCINPDTGGHYKDDVQIHKNPNKNQDFVSGGLSQGCIVVPEDIYSKDDDIFKNRQNNPDGNPPHYNSILMTAILGGYDEYIIPRFDDHKRKLQIQIILNEPVQIILNEPDSKVNSRYLMMHSDIVQDIVVKKNSAGLPEIVFYAPQGVFRDYYGGQYLYDVLTCAKLKLFIAKDDEKGGYAQIRLLYMGKLVPGKRAYSWDGYDSPPKTKNRKLQQAGKYFLVMESTFTPSPPNGSAPEERTIERKNPWVFEEFEIKAIA